MDPVRRAALRDALLRDGRVTNADFSVRTKSGAIRRLLLSAELIDLEGGQHALIAALDITDQRRLQEQFQKAFHSNPMAMSISTLQDGRYVDVNDGYLRMLGYSRDEVIGRRLDSFLAPGHVDHVMHRTLPRFWRQGYLEGQQSRYVRRDGTIIDTEVSAVAMRDPNGRRIALVVMQDITQLKRAQEQAVQAERLAAIGQMVTGLAHESGNALARSQACLEMLTWEVQDRPEALDDTIRDRYLGV